MALVGVFSTTAQYAPWRSKYSMHTERPRAESHTPNEGLPRKPNHPTRGVTRANTKQSYSTATTYPGAVVFLTAKALASRHELPIAEP